MVTAPQGPRHPGRTGGAADGKAGGGQEDLPQPPNPARSLFLGPHHLLLCGSWPDSLNWKLLFSRHSRARPNLTKSLDLPGAGVLPSCFLGSCCQPGGSRRQQDWLSLAAADSQQPGLRLRPARGSWAQLSTPALGASAPLSRPSCSHGSPIHAPQPAHLVSTTCTAG